MQVRRRTDGTLFVLDAYNANPDSMANALRSFIQAFPERPRVVVLGSMKELGTTAEAEHRALGRLLSTLTLQEVFFLGPEAPWVKTGYDEGGGRSHFAGSEDPREIERLLKERLSPGAAVFFKGSRSARLERIFDPLLENSAEPK
jgi:UDP-N-acetylmuramoyl-tripeptide--D-alanyl-D-alanine ligase